MKPGKEPDSLVATHVMNWPPMHPLSKPIPLYSTDIAAAWTVDKPGWLWEFKEMPATLTVILYTSFELRCKAMEIYPRIPKEVILIWHEWLKDKVQTYAWLRCLAALEAGDV